MATYYASKRFAANMYSKQEIARMNEIPVFDPNHSDTDKNADLYFKVWMITLRTRLEGLIGKEQTSEWIASLPPMSVKELAGKLNTWVEMERDHQAQDRTCTCCGREGEVDCYVCQGLPGEITF
jgi:hypothetical protein